MLLHESHEREKPADFLRGLFIFLCEDQLILIC